MEAEVDTPRVDIFSSISHHILQLTGHALVVFKSSLKWRNIQVRRWLLFSICVSPQSWWPPSSSPGQAYQRASWHAGGRTPSPCSRAHRQRRGQPPRGSALCHFANLSPLKWLVWSLSRRYEGYLSATILNWLNPHPWSSPYVKSSHPLTTVKSLRKARGQGVLYLGSINFVSWNWHQVDIHLVDIHWDFSNSLNRSEHDYAFWGCSNTWAASVWKKIFLALQILPISSTGWITPISLFTSITLTWSKELLKK